MNENETPPCKTHPDAPHGFDRNASHNADRYVCECEGWEPDEERKAEHLIISQHLKKALMGEPKKQWVGLTDEEKGWCGAPTLQETVARVEAKLKEKNGG